MAGKNPGMPPILDNKFLVAFLFVLLGVALYQSGFTAPWYLDDGNNIVLNPLITDLERAFAGIFRPRGVAYFSFAVNYFFTGMSPYWFRLTNVAIHIGAALLVWRLLTRLYPTALTPLLGGLLFLAHPLQTQAVTYIVQRMASMSAFFFLLSVYLYIRGRESGKRRSALCWQAIALLCAVLSLWTKQSTIFLPLVLLLVDYAVVDQQNFSLRRSIWRVAPFLLLSIVAFLQQFYAGPEILAALNVKAMAHTELVTVTAGEGSAMAEPSIFDAMPLRYFATELIVFWLYVKLFFLPYGQMLDYSGAWTIVNNVFNIKTLLATFGWILTFATITYCRLWNRRLVFGVAWIVLTLALESTFIPLDPVFEHRMYLPFFGACIVAYELFFKRIPVRAAGVIAVGVLLIFSAQTVVRNTLWADSLAFWLDNAQKAPKSTRIMLNLAKTYLDRGDNPHAEVWYTKALNDESSNSRANIFRATALVGLGCIRLRQERTDEAQVFFERALQDNADDLYANTNLGRLYVESGQVEKGIALMAHANRVDPTNSFTLEYLTEAYTQSGREVEAENFYRQALSIHPRNDQVRLALGLLLDKTGRSAEALDVLLLALEQYPEEAKYFYRYGIVALHAGDCDAYNMALDRLRNLSQVFYDKLLKTSGDGVPDGQP